MYRHVCLCTAAKIFKPPPHFLRFSIQVLSGFCLSGILCYCYIQYLYAIHTYMYMYTYTCTYVCMWPMHIHVHSYTHVLFNALYVHVCCVLYVHVYTLYGMFTHTHEYYPSNQSPLMRTPFLLKGIMIDKQDIVVHTDVFGIGAWPSILLDPTHTPTNLSHAYLYIHLWSVVSWVASMSPDPMWPWLSSMSTTHMYTYIRTYIVCCMCIIYVCA